MTSRQTVQHHYTISEKHILPIGQLFQNNIKRETMKSDHIVIAALLALTSCGNKETYNTEAEENQVLFLKKPKKLLVFLVKCI